MLGGFSFSNVMEEGAIDTHPILPKDYMSFPELS